MVQCVLRLVLWELGIKLFLTVSGSSLASICCSLAYRVPVSLCFGTACVRGPRGKAPPAGPIMGKRKRREAEAEGTVAHSEEQAGEEGDGGKTKVNWMVNEPALQMIQFRNYKPRDKMLQHFQLDPPVVKALITEDDIKKMGEPMTTENGIMDIAPKKANWDLKRDVARKLERLEKRTQRAIVDLIRDKVEGGGDLNKAIENRQKEAELGEEDED